MRTHRITLVMLLAAAVSAGVPAARADIASDRAAAILVFPRVLVGGIDEQDKSAFRRQAVDTIFQISNTTNDPVALHCFYVSANSRCAITGDLCDLEHLNFPCLAPGDTCLPNWTETDFHIELTGQQPIVWKASQGLAGD